jgi:hypothetical protein
LVWGSLSVAASAGMVAYGKLFLRKFKNISYL